MIISNDHLERTGWTTTKKQTNSQKKDKKQSTKDIITAPNKKSVACVFKERWKWYKKKLQCFCIQTLMGSLSHHNMKWWCRYVHYNQRPHFPNTSKMAKYGQFKQICVDSTIFQSSKMNCSNSLHPSRFKLSSVKCASTSLNQKKYSKLAITSITWMSSLKATFLSFFLLYA